MCMHCCTLVAVNPMLLLSGAISIALREREPPALVTEHIVSRWRQAE